MAEGLSVLKKTTDLNGNHLVSVENHYANNGGLANTDSMEMQENNM